MRVLCLFALLLPGPSIMAACNPELEGAWVLDYEHYLNVASGGNPATRQRLDEIWSGQPFVKYTLNPTTGQGRHESLSRGAWHGFDFTYQVTVEEGGRCTLMIAASDGQRSGYHESYLFWETESGFCLLPLEGAKWEDCFSADAQ